MARYRGAQGEAGRLQALEAVEVLGLVPAEVEREVDLLARLSAMLTRLITAAK